MPLSPEREGKSEVRAKGQDFSLGDEGLLGSVADSCMPREGSRTLKVYFLRMNFILTVFQ